MSSATATRAKKKRGLPKRVQMRHDHHFVEELARRSEPAIGRLIAISSVEPDPDQPRSEFGDLTDLVKSVEERGVLEPILVRPVADQTGGARFLIIAGERRYRAALQAGLLEVPAIEMQVDASEALEIALVENLQRKDLTPFEEADGFAALQESHGFTHEQISLAVGKSRVSVTETMALLKIPERVRDTANALGIKSKSLLLEVMKVPDQNEMIRLVERIAKQGLTRAALRNEIKKTPRTKHSQRPKPYVFKFKSPAKNYSLALSFRQSTVDHEDLIAALEEILTQLREEESS